jgi:hypothetical protein
MKSVGIEEQFKQYDLKNFIMELQKPFPARPHLIEVMQYK